MKFAHAPNTQPLEGFTIRRGIQRGGFGEVYYAVSDGGKEVALKLLTDNREIELRGIGQCLNLKHPNLLTIFDLRKDVHGDDWVVMEYVAGASLDDVLLAFRSGLPVAEVAGWLEGLCAGLQFLHDRGLVHRDLKPANVFRENGVVKIGDVGLSKRLGSGSRDPHTRSIGTVYYMAPEVARGQYGAAVDLYSLGVMTYEMLTGKLPFDGESVAEILMKHLTEQPDLRLVPEAFRPLIAQALQKDPALRSQSADEFLDRFRAALGPFPADGARLSPAGTAVPASGQPWPQSPPEWQRGAPVQAALPITPARPQVVQPPPIPDTNPLDWLITNSASSATRNRAIQWKSRLQRNTGNDVPIPHSSVVASVVAERWERAGQLAFNLAKTVLVAAGATAVLAVAMGLFLHRNPLSTLEEIALFGGVTILGAWLLQILAFSGLFERKSLQSTAVRTVLGGLVGLAAYGLVTILVTQISGDDLFNAASPTPYARLGKVELLDANHQPTAAGWMLQLALLMTFTRLEKPLRLQNGQAELGQWKIGSVIGSAMLAWVWCLFFPFATIWNVCWAAAISTTVQIVGRVPPEDRRLRAGTR